MRSTSYLILLLAIFASTQWAMGSNPTVEPQAKRTQVMIIGTHYLPTDIFKPDRQREINSLVESLSRFRADKIMVDVPYRSSWESSLNHTYRTFLDQEYIPNRTAREQIGFRLAKMNGLNELKGLDISSGFDLGSALREVSMNGDHETVNELIRIGKAIAIAKNEHAASQSLGQYLSYLNHPQNLSHEHSVYVRYLSRLGRNQSQIGAQLLSQWYEYHMQLFSNLARMADRSDERIIILVESSHVPVLRQLVDDDPEFELVDPLPYLGIQ